MRGKCGFVADKIGETSNKTMQYDYHRAEKENEIVSKLRCQPGEVWNETLQQCLAYGGGMKKQEKPSADKAISTESNSRKAPAAPALPQAGTL